MQLAPAKSARPLPFQPGHSRNSIPLEKAVPGLPALSVYLGPFYVLTPSRDSALEVAAIDLPNWGHYRRRRVCSLLRQFKVDAIGDGRQSITRAKVRAASRWLIKPREQCLMRGSRRSTRRW